MGNTWTEILIYFSDWVNSVISLIHIRIKQLSGSMMAKHLSHPHVAVPAHKAYNNVVCVCKSHYIGCFFWLLGIDNSLGNPSYAMTAHT